MNSERRVQRVRAAIAPPGEAKPDWEIVCRLAAALACAHLFRYETLADVWAEIRRVWEPGPGIAWRRLDEPGGLQWPCPTEDHPGTTLLHAQSFGATQGLQASLRTIEHTADAGAA